MTPSLPPALNIIALTTFAASLSGRALDPVLPRSLDGLVADTHLLGRPVRVTYHVRAGTSGPTAVRVNGTLLSAVGREPNPYRTGGLRVPVATLAPLLRPGGNQLEIEL